MSYATITAAIRGHLEALVLSPTKPIVWPNQKFKPESDGGEAGWLYCEIELNSGTQASFGGGSDIHRDTGLVVVNVVVPRNTLTGTAEAIADSIRSHFKVESLGASAIHFTNRWIGPGRLYEQESRWFVVPVLMEFWADRLEAPA